MPLLSAHDPLPRGVRRVLVSGTSGSGKTTLATRIAEALGVPHVELDALHHGPGWVPRPDFPADVEAFSARPAWVTEWQYDAVRPLLVARADLMVWLDLPRRVVMARVVRRTVRRRLRREVLWNGNTEPPLHTVLRDPDHVVRWAWRSHPRNALRVEELQQDRPDLPVVRLRSGREVARWTRGPLARAEGDRNPG